MIMIRAAFALLAIAVSAAIDARPAAAVIYRPWCVQYSGGSGNNGLTCAFSSFEQWRPRHRRLVRAEPVVSVVRRTWPGTGRRRSPPGPASVKRRQ